MSQNKEDVAIIPPARSHTPSNHEILMNAAKIVNESIVRLTSENIKSKNTKPKELDVIQQLSGVFSSLNKVIKNAEFEDSESKIFTTITQMASKIETHNYGDLAANLSTFNREISKLAITEQLRSLGVTDVVQQQSIIANVLEDPIVLEIVRETSEKSSLLQQPQKIADIIPPRFFSKQAIEQAITLAAPTFSLSTARSKIDAPSPSQSGNSPLSSISSDNKELIVSALPPISNPSMPQKAVNAATTSTITPAAGIALGSVAAATAATALGTAIPVAGIVLTVGVTAYALHNRVKTQKNIEKERNEFLLLYEFNALQQKKEDLLKDLRKQDPLLVEKYFDTYKDGLKASFDENYTTNTKIQPAHLGMAANGAKTAASASKLANSAVTSLGVMGTALPAVGLALSITNQVVNRTTFKNMTDLNKAIQSDITKMRRHVPRYSELSDLQDMVYREQVHLKAAQQFAEVLKDEKQTINFRDTMETAAEFVQSALVVDSTQTTSTARQVFNATIGTTPEPGKLLESLKEDMKNIDRSIGNILHPQSSNPSEKRKSAIDTLNPSAQKDITDIIHALSSVSDGKSDLTRVSNGKSDLTRVSNGTSHVMSR